MIRSSSLCLWLSLSMLTLVLAACCQPPPAVDDGFMAPGPSPIPQTPDSFDPDALSQRGNQKISSFRTSKKMIKDVFKGMEESFYCGCRYDKKKKVNYASCGYEVRKNKGRARRIEIEHVVPASAFGRNFAVWKDGHPECLSSKGKPYKGRRCAEKISDAFQHMEADLYNLQPAVGEVNADRSDKGIGRISGEKREYGKCDVEINKDFVEPRESIRGDIARIYMYMDWAYPGHNIINAENRALIEEWHKLDPISNDERTRGQRIARLQGNQNPFLE